MDLSSKYCQDWIWRNNYDKSVTCPSEDMDKRHHDIETDALPSYFPAPGAEHSSSSSSSSDSSDEGQRPHGTTKDKKKGKLKGKFKRNTSFSIRPFQQQI